MPDSDGAEQPSALEVETALALVMRDFEVPVLRNATVRIAVADQADPYNMDQIPDSEDWFFDGEKPILLQINKNVTDVSAGSLEGVKVAIASALQDFVVDETGRPWPQGLVDDSLRVLDVELDGREIAAWVSSGQVISRVGHLEQPQG